jgi:3-hydroxyisobutyrate dehydrogenase
MPIFSLLEEGNGGGLVGGNTTTVVLHSTVLPDRVRLLASMLGAHGINLVEAPVSGGPDRARNGELTAFMAGTASAIAAVRSLLDAIASERFVLGEIGAAAATKLANQLVMFAATDAVYEALNLTQAFGVDRDEALKAIAAATGDTWVGRNWGFYDSVVRDYDSGRTEPALRPWRKDLREFLSVADGAGVPAPMARYLVDSVGDRIESQATNSRPPRLSTSTRTSLATSSRDVGLARVSS